MRMKLLYSYSNTQVGLQDRRCRRNAKLLTTSMRVRTNLGAYSHFERRRLSIPEHISSGGISSESFGHVDMFDLACVLHSPVGWSRGTGHEEFG